MPSCVPTARGCPSASEVRLCDSSGFNVAFGKKVVASALNTTAAAAGLTDNVTDASAANPVLAVPMARAWGLAGGFIASPYWLAGTPTDVREGPITISSSPNITTVVIDLGASYTIADGEIFNTYGAFTPHWQYVGNDGVSFQLVDAAGGVLYETRRFGKNYELYDITSAPNTLMWRVMDSAVPSKGVAVQLNGPASSNKSPDNGVIRLLGGTDAVVASAFTSGATIALSFRASFTVTVCRMYGQPTVGNGFGFVVHQARGGANAIGSQGTSLGFQGVLKSVGVRWDFAGGLVSTGLGVEGVWNAASANVTFLQMTDCNPIAIVIEHVQGSQALVVNATNAVTGANHTARYPVNITTTLGSSMGYFGFVGSSSTRGLTVTISNFTMVAPLSDGGAQSLARSLPTARYVRVRKTQATPFIMGAEQIRATCGYADIAETKPANASGWTGTRDPHWVTDASETSIEVGGPVSWALWEREEGGTIVGRMPLPNGEDVKVVYHGDWVFWQGGGGIDYYTPSAPYVSTRVPNRPPPAHLIALGSATTRSLTFSRPVQDLFFAIVSLNSNGYLLSQDFDVLSCGTGYWGTGCFSRTARSDGLFSLDASGVEPHGTIQFKGRMSQLTWVSRTPEVWNGFTVAIGGASSTHWASDNTSSPWVEVDLEHSCALSALELVDVGSDGNLDGARVELLDANRTVVSSTVISDSTDGLYLSSPQRVWRVTAEKEACVQRIAPNVTFPRTRYVRVSSPSPNAPVSFAELRVCVGGVNIARSGNITVTTLTDRIPDFGVDGNLQNSVVANPSLSRGAWALLDLGADYDVEYSEIWADPNDASFDARNPVVTFEAANGTIVGTVSSFFPDDAITYSATLKGWPLNTVVSRPSSRCDSRYAPTGIWMPRTRFLRVAMNSSTAISMAVSEIRLCDKDGVNVASGAKVYALAQAAGHPSYVTDSRIDDARSYLAASSTSPYVVIDLGAEYDIFDGELYPRYSSASIFEAPANRLTVDAFRDGAWDSGSPLAGTPFMSSTGYAPQTYALTNATGMVKMWKIPADSQRNGLDLLWKAQGTVVPYLASENRLLLSNVGTTAAGSGTAFVGVPVGVDGFSASFMFTCRTGSGKRPGEAMSFMPATITVYETEEDPTAPV